MAGNALARLWVRSSMRSFHVTIGVVAVASQVIGRISGSPRTTVFGEIITLFGILHFFLHGYFHRQQKFVTDNMRVYSLPQKKIAQTGALYLAVFLVMTLIGMALVREIYSGTLLDKLKTLFLYCLGAIFGAVFETDGLGRDELTVQSNTDLLGAMNQIAAQSDSPWDNLINSVQTVLIIIGVLLLLVLCVMGLVSLARRLILRARPEAGRTVARNTADRETRLSGSAGTKERLLDFSPEAKVRRIYRKCINHRRGRGQAIPEWLAPAEIEQLVALPQDERYQALHAIYEKARYSEAGCTEDEVRRVKDLRI